MGKHPPEKQLGQFQLQRESMRDEGMQDKASLLGDLFVSEPLEKN